MPNKKLIDIILHALDDLKAVNVVALDVAKLTSITDTMIICTGNSNRHIKSIADNVVKEAKKHKLHILGQEGERNAEWVLIDLGDAVVHIMQPQAREFYNLEGLWDNGKNKIPLTANP